MKITVNYLIKCLLYCGVVYSAKEPLYAQQASNVPANMYEQATEVSGLIVQYGQDQRAVQTFYGVASPSGR